tara:strand:- start:92 stop:967 length:876 start_codon:yes stop_codon:yes gene_type:complete
MILKPFYWLYAFSFSLLISLGFLGYGIDYYEAYYEIKWGYGGILDRMGFVIAGAHLNSFSVGIFTVSFLQFINYHLLIKKSKLNSTYLYVVAIILSFSWSHLLQSLNMIRQGLSINLLILFFLSVRFSKFYIILHTITHKIALASVTLSVFMLFVKNLKIPFLPLLLRILFVLVVFQYGPRFGAGVVGKDLTVFFLVVTIIYEVVALFLNSKISKNLLILLYVSNSLIWVFLLIGINSYAERLFLSFFPVYFFLPAILFRLNLFVLIVYLLISLLYVLISWTVGPLQNALY